MCSTAPARLTSTAVAVAFWVFTGVTAVLSTAASARYGDVGTLEAVLALGSAGLATLWYERDSREREAPIPGWFGLFVFSLAVIAVPIYLLRYRGWRDGGLALFKIIGIAAGVVALVLAVEAVLLGPPVAWTG